MRSWSPAAEVARWEFRRYIKPKQQLLGMLVTFLVFGGCMAAGRLAAREDAAVQDVALIGADVLSLQESQPPSVRFTPYPASAEATLRQRVRDGSASGMLIVHSIHNAELVLRRSASWSSDVQLALATARQKYMLERTGITAESLAAILTPPRLDVTFASGTAGHSRGEKLSIIVVVSLMLMTVFLGMSYIFASITGEKQIRVTEQVVSAISPQSWIDGKILGLMAVSIVSALGQVVAFGAVYVALKRFMGAPELPLPDTLGNPGVIALIVLYGVLGLLFWFTFLAAIAATIDDPQHSARGSLLFVPLFASSMGYLVLRDADSVASRALALFPATAPAAMPVRLLMTEVAAAELLLSVGLLIAATIVLRIAAGKVFSAAMLMYGKEPSWREMRRWMADRSTPSPTRASR